MLTRGGGYRERLDVNFMPPFLVVEDERLLAFASAQRETSRRERRCHEARKSSCGGGGVAVDGTIGSGKPSVCRVYVKASACMSVWEGGKLDEVLLQRIRFALSEPVGRAAGHLSREGPRVLPGREAQPPTGVVRDGR